MNMNFLYARLEQKDIEAFDLLSRISKNFDEWNLLDGEVFGEMWPCLSRDKGTINSTKKEREGKARQRFTTRCVRPFAA